MTGTCKKLVCFALVTLLVTVSFSPEQSRAQADREYLQLSELLGKVKLAFLAAASEAPPSGTIAPKEIQLELKGVSSGDVSGKASILFFAFGSGVRKENAHSVSITLSPVSLGVVKMKASVASALSDAILAIYFGAASAKPEYELKAGQIELKCAIVREGKLGLTLKPLEANVDYKDELVQTIKIVF